MQIYARRVECKHIVWAGPLADTAATLEVAEAFRGRSCPTCGKVIGKVDFVGVQKPGSVFDQPPAPRRTENNLKKVSDRDVQRSRRHLTELKAETEGLAADLKKEAIRHSPPSWRKALTKIPVGILPTYEPNAECIRFADSELPVLVFHQGLAGYLFGMNRSILPLARTASLSGGAAAAFVDDAKTRKALQVQAVGTALQFLGAGLPATKDLVGIPDVVRLLEMPLTRLMATFVLCHEYGHAVLNHSDELLAVTAGGKGCSLLERSRAMEHEADTWGQDAVIGAFAGGKPLESSLDVLDALFPTSAAGLKLDFAHAAPCIALLYFEFLDVVEERLLRQGVRLGAQSTGLGAYRRGARQGARDNSTHPSNRDRFQALYAHLTQQSNFTAHTWVSAFEDLVDELKADLDPLIDRTGRIPDHRFASRLSWFPGRKRKRRTGSGDLMRPDSWRADEWYQGDQKEAIPQLEAAFEQLEGKAKRVPFDRATVTENSIGLVKIGQDREGRKDLKGAKAAYRQGLTEGPGSEGAALCAFLLGKLLIEEGADAAAEPVLEVAAGSDLAGFRLQASFWLGTIAHGRDDFQPAIAAYRKIYEHRAEASQLLPSLPGKAALNLGRIYDQTGRVRTAIEWYEKAKASLPATDREMTRHAREHLESARARSGQGL